MVLGRRGDLEETIQEMGVAGRYVQAVGVVATKDVNGVVEKWDGGGGQSRKVADGVRKGRGRCFEEHTETQKRSEATKEKRKK